MLTKILIYMILFFIVASPATFKFMRKILGGWVATAEGLPHAPGLLLHAAVYVLLACYIPAKLVSSFAEDFEDEQYDSDVYTSAAKSHPSMVPSESYIGEYGVTKNSFGINSEERVEN
jgi:hypothetical protein